MNDQTLFPEIETQQRVYHNTTNLAGAELKQREMRATSQARMILEYWRENPEKQMTPWDIVRIFGWPERKKVSAGRAFTDLTRCKEAYLIKTTEKRKEACGDWNHVWKLNPDADQTIFTMTSWLRTIRKTRLKSRYPIQQSHVRPVAKFMSKK